MTRVFSGMQPSAGDLHLGNHLGALVNWVRLQETRDCVYCIVDLHAITVSHDPAELRQRTINVATNYLAAGVDPTDSILFVQSQVHEHAEATWLLNCVAGYGELGRMPQFKEKSAAQVGTSNQITVGLFDYPVLQAADILLYDTDEVPVGEDQVHHIELARDLGQRFNHRFGDDIFTLPEAVVPEAGARIMDLQDPTNKMSKSTSSDKGIINLLDEPARILKKFKSAVTDSEAQVRYDRANKAGISNLLEIFSAASGRSIDDIAGEYSAQGYGTFKVATAEAVIECVRPVQERQAELAKDPAEVERILRDGAARASEIAAVTLSRAKQGIGFLTS